MANTIDKELNDCITRLNEAEKKSVLLMLRTFLSGRETSQHISLDEYNREIDEALAEAEAGEFITQEEMEKRAAKW
jgi:predicted transcriptional regulator